LARRFLLGALAPLALGNGQNMLHGIHSLSPLK
jgi:hypothetical protein